MYLPFKKANITRCRRISLGEAEYNCAEGAICCYRAKRGKGVLMELQEIKNSDSARLWAVETSKFKKNVLSMSLVLPLGPGTTPLDLLFPKVLVRGTADYPTNISLKRKLEELYDARIRESYRYFGDCLKVGFDADFLDDRVVGSVLEGVIDLLAGIWQRPALDSDELLREGEVSLAKRAVCDSIRAEINNTAVYAANRCREIMCAGEPYGYSLTEPEVEKITMAALTERYRQVRDSAYLTFFYVGPKPAEQVAYCWLIAFSPAPNCPGVQPPALSPTPGAARSARDKHAGDPGQACHGIFNRRTGLFGQPGLLRHVPCR